MSEPFAVMPPEWQDPEILQPLHRIWAHMLELTGRPVTACDAGTIAFGSDWEHFERTGERIIPKAPWFGTKCGEDCPNRRVWLIPNGQCCQLPDGHVRYAFFPGVTPPREVEPGRWAIAENIPGREIGRYSASCDDLPAGHAAVFQAFQDEQSWIQTWATVEGSAVWWCVDVREGGGDVSARMRIKFAQECADALVRPGCPNAQELRERIKAMGVPL